MSYIGYGIYVGTLRAACAKILSDNGITHVLSLLKPGEEPEETLDGFTCKKYAITDENTHVKPDFIKIVDSAVSFIHQGTAGKNKILVHCGRGRSWSVMTVMAYLKKKKSFTWFQAFYQVADKRPYIGLHDKFSEYLREKEEEEGEEDGPENFDFTLDGFPWEVKDEIARKNAQDLRKVQTEGKERQKRTGIPPNKYVVDTRRNECVKLAVQVPTRRGKSSLPLSNRDVME